MLITEHSKLFINFQKFALNIDGNGEAEGEGLKERKREREKEKS